MPKVDENYIIKKKKDIIDATRRACQQKPLYELNMSDIIREAGLSKGGIYLYYHDIDSIIIEMVNTVVSPTALKSGIEELTDSSRIDSGTVKKILFFIGNHIYSLSPEFLKLRYELRVICSSDGTRSKRIHENVLLGREDEFLENAFTKVISTLSPLVYDDYSPQQMASVLVIALEGIIDKLTMARVYNATEYNDFFQELMLLSTMVDSFIVKRP